jgi:hypothetical protein
MSDSQRSWIGVKGWLDKSSQISKRLVPRRNSKKDSSTFEPKEVSELPAQRLRNKESPPYYPAPPPSAAPSSRNGQRRMSTSNKQYTTGYSEAQYSDDKRRYSQLRPLGAPSSVNTDGYPRPRFSKRHSDQQSYTTQSASVHLDDVDRRLSRRRSNTGESQNGKVISDRRESRASNVYSEDITRRARGGAEPIRASYPDSTPASRGRPTADVIEASRSDKDINIAQVDDLDAGNRLGPPRSSMSKTSSGIPDGHSRRLVKRRDSHVSDYDEVAIHMKQLKLSEDLEKSRGRDRSRSRTRGRSVRELLTSRREEADTSQYDEKRRGRSLSRGSRFSSRSRSVDPRTRRPNPDAEVGSQEKARRRGSVLLHPSAPGKEHHPVMVTQDGHRIRSEHEVNSNLKRALSRSPSRNSVHSRRHQSRSPSRASLRSQTRDIPVAPQVSLARRASDASDHIMSGRARPSSIISHSLPVGYGAPGVLRPSSSRHLSEQDVRHMEEENERRRRRASTASSVEKPRISPTDPRNPRGILRRTGRISSFTDGPPPKPPTASSTKAEPSRTRRISRSRSGSRSGTGKSDEEDHALRNNTIHNARNLKYQPHRDGYPSSTSPSGRRGLVPVRYPSTDGMGRQLPPRRYTTSSVGTMPPIAMPRRQSYLVEHPVVVSPGAGPEMWYPSWPGNGIPVVHDPYTDPYEYVVHPSQIPPSHAQYSSWPPDGREVYPQRRGDSGPFMRPGSRA